MKKKRSSIFAMFTGMPQCYTASAVIFDAIGRVWLRYASALPFDGVTGLHADGEFELAYNEAGDMVSNIPSYYEFFSKDARPAQTIIDRYGKLPN